jgi:hypothetical protein
MSKPGTTPAMRRLAIDVEAAIPYTTRMMEGGMMGPIAEAAATKAVA